MTSSMQQQINDLVQGKHKDWHLLSARTKAYGDLGWEYLNPGDEPWRFEAGFDTEAEARECAERAERICAEGEQYGATQYEFKVVENG